MDKDTRNAIQRATQSARALLEREVGQQLEGIYDIRLDGAIPDEPGAHLDEAQRLTQEKLVAAVSHHAALGRTRAEAVGDYLREAAFTTLNRFVALKLLEARELVQECVSAGDQSGGFKEFCGLAPGLVQLPDQGYRLYLESLFDEIGQEVGILFDRRDPSSLIWPRRQALNQLLEILNAKPLSGVWDDDETIGWFYQHFNSSDERRQMRDESHAPRNSRELAVRNQFFTPRYVVRFLVDNTLARTWWQMRGGDTRLTETCEFLALENADELVRDKKDPRDITIIDPACGSGHFLLYAFDLLETIYEEAWHDDASPASSATGSTLRQTYPELGELRRALPAIILRNNLFGVDIDPRAAQIAALALWLRAQRAYREYGIAAAARPRITRTHVVVAEPMPGDQALVDAFADGLQPPLLAGLFRRMTSEMRLAGELGPLLLVDDAIASTLTKAREEYVQQATTPHLPGLEPERKQEELDFSEIDDVQFFEEAEAILLDALRRFAESAGGGGGVRRWLFADDAVQGIAFIDLISRRYDVVLMNPPFGLMPRRVYEYLTRRYPNAYYDLAAAFLERGKSMLIPSGLCGAITTRAFMTVAVATRFRQTTVLEAFELIADLGEGVMDGAAVDAAAELLSRNPPRELVFWDLRDASDKPEVLLAHVRGTRDSIRLGRDVFGSVPGARLAYDAVGVVQPLFARTHAEGVEPAAGLARTGARTFDDVRFLRARWEVDPDAIDSVWVPISRTAEEFSMFYAPSYIVTKWNGDGAELAARNEQVNGQTAQARQGSAFYGRPGVVFSRRGSPSISFRIHPAGSAFASTSGVVFPGRDDDLLVLLAYLNSTAVRATINSLSNRDSYTVGHVKRIVWPRFSSSERLLLETWGRHLVEHQQHLFSSVDEADPYFSGGWLRRADSFGASVASWKRAVEEIATQKLEIMSRIDEVVANATGLESVDRVSEVFGVNAGDAAQPTRLSDLDTAEFASSALSVALGIALGRWVWGVENAPPVPDSLSAWRPLPRRPPLARPRPQKVVLVDDEGHPDDVVHRVREALAQIWPERREESIAEIEDVVGDLRTWFRQNAFANHLVRYTRGKRRGPVYWQLSSPRRHYSVWLFVHAIDRDTLFRVQSDWVAPKLEFEERRLAGLLSDARTPRGAVALQEEIVDDLRRFDAEIRSLAPIFAPHFDDGVITNFAPLWRLVPQHPRWQRELQSAWQELLSGEWDWAQLAMRLWPERVVPKCAEDRSLAIAHGLEEVFWVEDRDGKWRRREEPTVSIGELVSQRTSTAVKDALGAVP